MTNKAKVEKQAKELGYTIGIYNDKIDLMTTKELNKVLENMEFQADTDVSIKRKKHVVEIDIVDNEVDLKVLTKNEYIDRYGNERYED